MKNKLHELTSKWNDISDKDKKMIGLAAAVTGSLFVSKMLKTNSRNREMEIIKIIVPKDSEALIIVRGGK